MNLHLILTIWVEKGALVESIFIILGIDVLQIVGRVRATKKSYELLLVLLVLQGLLLLDLHNTLLKEDC